MGRGGLFEKNIHPRERPNLWLMVFRFHPPYNEGTVEFFIPRYAEKSRLLLDMKPYLDKTRFRSLSDPRVWSSAVTNGIFVRFGNVELSHDELLSMAEQEH